MDAVQRLAEIQQIVVNLKQEIAAIQKRVAELNQHITELMPPDLPNRKNDNGLEIPHKILSRRSRISRGAPAHLKGFHQFVRIRPKP
jgi:hypothetical protein